MPNRPRPKIKPSTLKRVTVDTRFYIDYTWWEESDLDIRTYLFTRLNIGEDVALETEIDQVDIVDAETGQVRRVDGFQYMVQIYFNQMPDDFMARTSLVDGVFCVLLANANRPMSVTEIAAKVGRSPETVLRTISGPRVYQGIRPVLDD